MDPYSVGTGGVAGLLATVIFKLIDRQSYSDHVTKDACHVCHQSTLRELTAIRDAAAHERSLIRKDLDEIKTDVKVLLRHSRDLRDQG